MLKHLCGTLLFVVGICAAGNAQTTEQLSDGYVHGNEVRQVKKNEVPDSIKPAEKVQVGMSVGTSVMFGSGGAGTSTWLAPNLSYRVSPRFTVAAGLRLEINTGNRYMYSLADGSTMSLYRPTTSYLMFASGSYDLNAKMRLTGTVFAGTQVYDLPGMKASSYNLNTYGGTLNLDYKLSEHSTISVGVGVSHGPAYNTASPLRDNNPMPIR